MLLSHPVGIMACMLDENVRPHTRRNGPLQYLPARMPNAVISLRVKERPPAHIEVFVAAGAAGSALRRELRARGIDPKLARMLLLFYGERRLRPSEVAWRCNVHPSTASRWLDRAERAALVDKFYDDLIDGRATYARITEKGRAVRDQAARIIAAAAPHQRPVQVVARGRRAVARNGCDDWGEWDYV